MTHPPGTKTTAFDNLLNGHPMRPTPITKPSRDTDGAYVVVENQDVTR
jgi:hypothetical protein